MKKILYIAFLTSFLGYAQEMESVQNGYFRAQVGDTILGNRTTERKAKDDGYNYASKRGISSYKILFPNEVMVTMPVIDLPVNVATEIIYLDYETGLPVIPQPLPEITPIAKAPKIESVLVVGTDIVVTFSNENSLLPANYDMFLDGIDQNEHLSEMSRTIPNLDLTKVHTFAFESRYTTATYFDFYRSETVTYYPMAEQNEVSNLRNVIDLGTVLYLAIKLGATESLPEGGWDTFVNGVNRNDHGYYPVGTKILNADGTSYGISINQSRLILGGDSSVERCIDLQKRYTQYEIELYMMTNKICIPAK